MAVLALAAAFLAGRYSLPGGAPDAPAEQTARAGGKTEQQVQKKQQQDGPVKGWRKGKGWGWVWGDQDEVGSLNAMTAETIRAALALVKEGKVYDLGVPYDRESYKWPGHSPGEIMTFRGPEGVKRQGDVKAINDKDFNPKKMAWHSCALFINDNVGTQIDGLGHITEGDDNHWYNGYPEAKWGGNWGVRKCDATTIPPIITRGVMIDVAALRKVDALPSNYKITAADLEGALERQKTKLRPGDTVLVRTGTLKYWGVSGGDHKKLGEHDSAGIDLGAARWLVEQQGAILIGSDTSGLEHGQAGTFIPVHRYLLVEQGVHIGEFHYLEDLARDGVYEFCYVCMTNKIRGTTAGFALRPIAIR
jgi:kynurenine formamidase